MISSGPSDSNPTVSSIRFRDGTTLESGEYVEDFQVRKRLRVSDEGVFDRDVIIEGSLTVRGETTLEQGSNEDTTHITDMIDDLYYKIGWDKTLSRWKYSQYINGDTATLDYRLQELDFSNYYTKTEVDSKIYYTSTFAWENY